jgi:exosome complex RNA-binding protein Rrp4
MIAGDGTYSYLGKIYSNVRGTVEIVPKKSWNNQEDLDRI